MSYSLHSYQPSEPIAHEPLGLGRFVREFWLLLAFVLMLLWFFALLSYSTLDPAWSTTGSGPADRIVVVGGGVLGLLVAWLGARLPGAEVTLVTGPVSLPDLPGVRVVRVESALEMKAAIDEAARGADAVVMTAAVADYRAAAPKGEKEAKVAANTTIELIPNPDILAGLGAAQADEPGRVLVGFAMETHAGVERAALKAQRKNADLILLNYPTRAGTAFGGDDNEVTLVRPDGSHEDWPRQSKRAVARGLLDEVGRLWEARAPKPRSGGA